MIAARINSNSKKIILLPISFQKKARSVLPRAYFIFNLFCAVDFIVFFAPRADFIYRVFSSALFAKARRAAKGSIGW